MSDSFSKSQLEFVRKFAEALFYGFEDMAIPVERVVQNFKTQFDLIGDPARARMKKIIDFRPFWLNIFFNELSLEKRHEILDEKFRLAKDNTHQDLARLRSILYGAYYGHWIGLDEDDNAHNPVHKQIGYTLPKFRTRAGTDIDRKIEVFPNREIAREHVLEPHEVKPAYDIIVIGSGSGGAVAARNLVIKHGYTDVLIIEAGPFMPSKAITVEERLMGAKLYKEGTLQVTKDNDIVLFQGSSVGGSPTVNNGICLRMAHDPLGNDTAWNPFDIWKDEFDLDLEAKFMKAYDEVQAYLGIGEVEHESGQGNGEHLFAAWNKFAAGRTESWIEGAHPGWFRKSYGPPHTAKACVYCGYCNTGCPYARKAAPAQTYLPEACKAGARILADSKVEKIVLEREVRGGPLRATGVQVSVGKEGKVRTVEARVGVVLAAGTIASSVLLDESGIDGTGEGISLVVASPIVALMHEEATVPPGFKPSWNEDQMTTAVDCGTFLLESHFQPPQSMSMLMPGWFGEMDRRMKAYSRIRSAGILIPVDRAGKLKDGQVKANFTEQNMILLRKALSTLAEVHFANGAIEVWPGLRSGNPLKLVGGKPPTRAQIDQFFELEVKEKDDVTLSSAHIHGGNPMSNHPEDGVVDPRCKVHGTENLFVTDASVFPSNIRVNAHFTTMALAQYATYASDPFAAP